MINTTYEPFSRQPEYIEVNRGFLQSLQLQGCETVLDLACGTGTLTELLLDLCAIKEILGVDISHESLMLGCEHFTKLGLFGRNSDLEENIGKGHNSHLFFLRGSADCLPLKDQSMDAVVMGNSIHILPDQDMLLREVNKVLKPGGLFAFNTSFFAGTYPSGTETLYHQWMKIALEYIQSKNQERRRLGLEGIRRRKGTSHQAFSKRWPTPEELTQLLERNSFEVKSYCHRSIIMNQRSLETVGSYAGLACVLLSGYPVEIACEALEAAAGPAFEVYGSHEVRRLWLEVAAVKSNS
jgi:ubiquinone/menaquinone biosynthesis C-methylase UbiE